MYDLRSNLHKMLSIFNICKIRQLNKLKVSGYLFIEPIIIRNYASYTIKQRSNILLAHYSNYFHIVAIG